MTTEVTEDSIMPSGAWYTSKQFKSAVGIKDHNTFLSRLREFNINGLTRLGLKHKWYTSNQVKKFLEMDAARRSERKSKVDSNIPIQIRRDFDTLRELVMTERVRVSKEYGDLDVRVRDTVFATLSEAEKNVKAQLQHYAREISKLKDDLATIQDRLDKLERS